jgi:hypothetical protein
MTNLWTWLYLLKSEEKRTLKHYKPKGNLDYKLDYLIFQEL